MKIMLWQSFFNVSRVNQKLHRDNPTELEGANQRDNKKDKLTISRNGKFMNMIEILMKQKEDKIKELKDKSSELMSDIAEKTDRTNEKIKEDVEKIDKKARETENSLDIVEDMDTK